MLSVSEDYLREHNSGGRPYLYGPDWNDHAWSVCRSDMLRGAEQRRDPRGTPYKGAPAVTLGAWRGGLMLISRPPRLLVPERAPSVHRGRSSATLCRHGKDCRALK